jgi:hypothetical protein
MATTASPRQSRLLDAFRHPVFVAFFSVILGTWLFGVYTNWQARVDSRREKSIAFLEETSKGLNGVLTDVFLCIQNKKAPVSDSLSRSCNDLFRQRMAVAIKSKAFLESTTFSEEYDGLVQDIEKISDALYESDPPPYDQLQVDADNLWMQTRDLLTGALSDAMTQPSSPLWPKLFSSKPARKLPGPRKEQNK